nr:hypothetical protein [Gloiopeltis furcata]
MSHFSQIKTILTNQIVLQKTLQDLNLKYHLVTFTGKQDAPACNKSFSVMTNQNDKFSFTWNSNEYLFVADLQTWSSEIPYNILVDRIAQQYSYNSILDTSSKEGFTNLDHQITKEGSIKLIIQKWT